MVAQRRWTEQALRESEQGLKERAKELNCLYGISNLVQRPDISLEEILQGTVNLIPPAWQYPEITCARIVLGGQEYLTDNFRETAWRQTSDIIVNGERTGAVEVCYLEEKPESDEGPFLTEERGLINAIAERLGRVSERKQVDETLRDSEERFRLAINATKDGLWEWDIQTNQEFFSPRWCEIIGYSFDDPELPHTYESWASRIHPDDYDLVVSAMTNHLEKGTTYNVDYRHRHKSGEYRWQNSTGQAVLDESGKPIKMVGCISDITDRKEEEAALRESEERYRSIFESIQDIFYRTDAEGIITEISPSVERFGYTREQLVGAQVLEIYEDPEERSGLLKVLLEQGEVTDYEIRLKTGDGSVIDISVSGHVLRGPDGTFIGTEGTLRDISDRRAAEEALHEQARRDPLTGVLNHGAIVGEIRSLISSGEQAAPWTLAMIDVDHLKVMNDTYGHQVGDAVLVAVATALSRDDALVGRYGGDEFVAILRGADRAAAEGYRSKATDALAGATVSDPQTGESVLVEASIGLAVYPEDATTLADLIKISDDAMYGVKRQRPVRRLSPRKHAPARKAA
jgi:diguanylate cyclase (GGDEF)-like protein/PAS domain S-box-containing protein